MNTKSLGIALVLWGMPIFFLRDDIGLSPGNFYFTGLFMSIFLLLLVNKNIIYFRFYRPNLLLFGLAFTFLGFSFIRLLLSDYDEKIKDIFYFGYLSVYLILLVSIEEHHISNIHKSAIIVSLLSNVLLLYSFGFEEKLLIGQRVYMGETGNPNIVAFVSAIGIVASILLLKEEKILWKNFAFLNVISSAYVIFLAQTRTILNFFISYLTNPFISLCPTI